MLAHTNTNTDESLLYRLRSNNYLCTYRRDVSPYKSTYLEITTYIPTYSSLLKLLFNSELMIVST